jgi:hypothetical protein
LSADRGIEVWDLALSVPTGGDGADRYPVVRSLRARLSAETVAKLLTRIGLEGRLIEGGAILNVKLPLANVTAELKGSVPGNGRLRIEAVSLRLGGLLPVPPALAELALGRVEGKPGIYRSGSRTVDLDLGGLLAALPLRWRTGIRAARITKEFLEIECVEQ